MTSLKVQFLPLTCSDGPACQRVSCDGGLLMFPRARAEGFAIGTDNRYNLHEQNKPHSNGDEKSDLCVS